MGLFSSNQSYLGIDIGTSGIKVVELKKEGREIKLLTYGFSENANIKAHYDWYDNVVQTAKIINEICKKAGAVSRNAISALPTFAVFSSVLNLTGVSGKDIDSAVRWEAKKVIPLPLEEMDLDWKKIEDGSNNKETKVLLMGAPKALVGKYVNIFKEAKINLLSLETETFSLIRSLLGNDKSTVMILEIGTNTTDISIINNKIPLLNRSIDVGGITITNAISNNLNIGLERAEQFKYDLGISLMNSQDDNIVPQTILEAINPIVNEVKYAINLFQSKNENKVEKIILSGGSALLPNLPEYLSKILDMKVIIGDPWVRISYPTELKQLLTEIGPRMSVAIGLAMRNIWK